MTVGDKVKFSGRDIHRLRESLTDEVGTVTLIAREVAPDHGQHEVYVEFNRDRHRPFSEGWWIAPSRLRRV